MATPTIFALTVRSQVELADTVEPEVFKIAADGQGVRMWGYDRATPDQPGVLVAEWPGGRLERLDAKAWHIVPLDGAVVTLRQTRCACGNPLSGFTIPTR